MHLRRALLLFGIVLGLAALAASVSRPPDQTSDNARREPPPASETERTPTASPGPAEPSQPPAELSFDAGRDQTLRLEPEQPATVLVEVDEPGAVEIAELGLESAATPLTPARFELFVTDPGRYPISFTPAAGDEQRGAGTLVVTAAER